eukprot:scaffold37258_cov30-Phaeocystis_antarctica.AAC.1
MSRGVCWPRATILCTSMRWVRASRRSDGASPSMSSWDAIQGSALAMSRSSSRWQVSRVRTSRGQLPREALACRPGPRASTLNWVCWATCLPTPPGCEYWVAVVP